MSKVILLSGSPNAEGNTVQVLRECAKTIEANGVEAEVISLAGMKLHDAMDFTSGDDGFDAVIAKIKEADGLIVGGPVYWGTVRAQLMTALQRLAMASAQQGNFLSRMVGGPVAVARRGVAAGDDDVLSVQRHDRPRLHLLEHRFRPGTRRGPAGRGGHEHDSPLR